MISQSLATKASQAALEGFNSKLEAAKGLRHIDTVLASERDARGQLIETTARSRIVRLESGDSEFIENCRAAGEEIGALKEAACQNTVEINSDLEGLEVVYAENWPLSFIQSSDQSMVKITERGAPLVQARTM